MPDWYALQTLTGREARVASDLAGMGHDAFTPRASFPRHSKDGWAQEERSLYPGYAFVRLPDLDATYRRVKNVFGVTQFVGVDKVRPVPLSVEDETHILWLGRDVIPPSKVRRSDVGRDCEVVEGALKPYEHDITHVDWHRRRAYARIWHPGGGMREVEFAIELV